MRKFLMVLTALAGVAAVSHSAQAAKVTAVMPVLDDRAMVQPVQYYPGWREREFRQERYEHWRRHEARREWRERQRYYGRPYGGYYGQRHSNGW